jgi:hypothetical protein
MPKPKRFFNVAGPCVPGEHYMLDPLRGIGGELTNLIDAKQYFVLHAARQSGKTTLLKQLTRDINAGGDYYALYCSLEALQTVVEPAVGIPAIIDNIGFCIKKFGLPGGFANDSGGGVSVALNVALVDYCRSLDKPLVILFDEADCLSNGTLIMFLRQLREGYINRADVPFVHSVALVGMRNVCSYGNILRESAVTPEHVVPFNIVTRTFNLRNFTKSEVIELCVQHTTETGQIFEQQALEYVFEQTQGQPWLVNAIARECVEEITSRDYTILITQSVAKKAVQNIISVRGTHADSIFKRLKEPQVRKVIEPLIKGEKVFSTDDYRYTKDLGLIKNDCGKIEPANSIYTSWFAMALGTAKSTTQ